MRASRNLQPGIGSNDFEIILGTTGLTQNEENFTIVKTRRFILFATFVVIAVAYQVFH